MTLFGESEARYAALAGLVHGARVLDLREHSDGRCIDALVTAGATSITVCAPESVRHHLTTQNVELRLVAPLALPLELGASSFDVVICFDLLARAAVDPVWTSAVREVLAPEGALIIASAAAEEAAAALGATFGNTTVFAQSPMVGHMLYDVGVEELEPELDRTWADDGHDEPSSYMVVFAPDERHSEKLTLVQMPFSSWNKLAAAETETLRAERDSLAHELTTAREEIARGAWKQGQDTGDVAAVQGELVGARNEIAVLLGELESTRAELDRLSGRAPAAPAELAEELARHRNDRASLEAQIADLLEESALMSSRRVEWQARLDGIEQELATERARVAELTSQAVGAAARGDELEERLRREETRGIALDQETAAERIRAADLEAAYAQAQARIAELEESAGRDQRSLDASRRRGDDLARDLDAERQQQAELKDGLESERHRLEEMRQALAESEAARMSPTVPAPSSEQPADAERQTAEGDDALAEAKKVAEEAQDALTQARRENSEALEALRNEQFRNEQLLARLVDLERQVGVPPKEEEMEDPSGGKAVDGES